MMKKREWFYPLKLDYVTRGYIWGGTRLSEEWGKKPTSGSDVIAESWELTVSAAGARMPRYGRRNRERKSDEQDHKRRVQGNDVEGIFCSGRI